MCFKAYQGKLTAGHLNNSTDKVSNRKKIEEIESLVSKYKVGASVDQTSGILEGKEFCVISGLKDLSKERIEKLILENGGAVRKVPGEIFLSISELNSPSCSHKNLNTQKHLTLAVCFLVNLSGSSTFCLIAGDMNIKVKNLMKAGKHTVVQYSWLQQCLESKKLVDLNPQTLVGTTLKGMFSLNQKFDQFGDSFLNSIDETALITTMEKMDQYESVRLLLSNLN